MKKILFLLMAILVSIGLGGCGDKPKAEEKKTVKLELNSDLITSNEKGIAKIIGQTDTKATITADGKIGTIKKDGNFSFEVKINDDEEAKYIDIVAKRKGYKDKSILVTVKNGRVPTGLKTPVNINTNSNGVPTIKGTAQPGTKLVIEGVEIFADSKGQFSYDAVPLNVEEKEKEIKIIAKKEGYTRNEVVVTATNKSTAYLDKVAREEKAREEQEAKEEAERKAKAEREAKEKEEQERKERLGIEGENALIKAQDYAEIMYMSKAAIYDQLTSEYGEQFSKEAAQYAVDNLKADYNANALIKAKEYQESMAMSPAAIRDQLTSEYGEQFTPSEADYAIQHLND
jgi:hypothetical protein